VGKFKGRATVVIDEADRLEDTILRFAELSITDRLLNRLSMDLPKHVTVYDSWLDWANRNLPRVTQQRELLAKSIKSGHRDNIKLFKSVDNLYNKLSDFENLVTSDWIYQDTVTKYGLRYSFRPVWVSDLCSRLFWSHASRFVLMSATILNAEDMAYTLGIYHDYHFQQLPSLFDPSRRQVIYRPAANLTRNTMTEELPKAIAEVQRILDAHPNSKGLIHTVSYSNAKYLTDTIKSPRFVTHDGSLSRQDILDNFKQSTQPLVLVSPSMDRGIDLPDDECRFIIILKVPFPYLGDKQVKQRFWSGARGKRWYEWMTACTIVQMTGRGMRHDQDQCTSYILDRQFERFYGKSGSLFPKWWSDSLTVE
jgi:Rad3-related DNA helicase